MTAIRELRNSISRRRPLARTQYSESAPHTLCRPFQRRSDPHRGLACSTHLAQQAIFILSPLDIAALCQSAVPLWKQHPFRKRAIGNEPSPKRLASFQPPGAIEGLRRPVTILQLATCSLAHVASVGAGRGRL